MGAAELCWPVKVVCYASLHRPLSVMCDAGLCIEANLLGTENDRTEPAQQVPASSMLGAAVGRLSHREMEHSKLTSLQKVAIDCLAWSLSL